MHRLTLSPNEKERRTRAITVLSLLAILIVVVFIVSMNTGFMRLSPGRYYIHCWEMELISKS